MCCFDLTNYDIELKINLLIANGRLPTFTTGLWNLKRWQNKEWPSAIHFSMGTGRYNSSNNAFKVCYLADRAITALAESYGRLWHMQGLRFIEAQSIYTSRMCLIKPMRPLVFIEITKLLGMLHIPLDALVGKDYRLTQSVMDYLFKIAKDKADGLCYISRHWPLNYCYSVWETSETIFQDVEMKNLAEYRDAEYLPNGWEYPDISAEELLEEVLQFKIISLEI